jgi:hypothetical protein
LLPALEAPGQGAFGRKHVSSNFVGKVRVAGTLAALLLGCGEKEPLPTAYREAYA